MLTGFAGSAADAFALLERFEKKLGEHPDNTRRAVIELAKDWRTDRVLRRLEAMLAVVDTTTSLIVSGAGDVIEPTDGVIGIGSGGAYALSAAKALLLALEARARRKSSKPPCGSPATSASTRTRTFAWRRSKAAGMHGASVADGSEDAGRCLSPELDSRTMRSTVNVVPARARSAMQMVKIRIPDQPGRPDASLS